MELAAWLPYDNSPTEYRKRYFVQRVLCPFPFVILPHISSRLQRYVLRRFFLPLAQAI